MTISKAVDGFDYVIELEPLARPREGQVFDITGARHQPHRPAKAHPVQPEPGPPTSARASLPANDSALEGVELRIVIPREAIPAASRPEYFSQDNCELLGLKKRAFLRLLREPDAPPVVEVGKRRLVKREHMFRFLDRLSVARSSSPSSSPKPADLDGPDQILAELGCLPARPSGKTE